MINTIQIGNVSVITDNIMDKNAEEWTKQMIARIKHVGSAVGLDEDAEKICDQFYDVILESVRAIQAGERERIRQQMRQDF